MGSETNLLSVMYFEPPHEQQVEVRLAQAPGCFHAPLDGAASSPGHLDLSLDGGKIHLQGEGLLWQRHDQSLIVSNQVHTVIKMGTWKLTT